MHFQLVVVDAKHSTFPTSQTAFVQDGVDMLKGMRHTFSGLKSKSFRKQGEVKVYKRLGKSVHEVINTSPSAYPDRDSHLSMVLQSLIVGEAG